MSLSSWRERAKIGALAAALLLCLATLSTTSSFGMGQRDLPRLQVQQSRILCDKYHAAALKSCEQDKSNSCRQKSIEQGQKCQRAMRQASKRLNSMGGCLKAEQQVVLCELEWCTDGLSGLPTGTTPCRTECEGVRKVLRQCIDKQVQHSLQAFGLASLKE